MVQIKVGHLIGTLITVLMAVAGSAFTIYSETTSAIQANTKDIEHVHEVFELRLEPIDKNLEEMKGQLRRIEEKL